MSRSKVAEQLGGIDNIAEFRLDLGDELLQPTQGESFKPQWSFSRPIRVSVRESVRLRRGRP